MIRVHPGEILADELEARNMSANALALKMRVPANRLTEIIKGRRAVSPETALRLGRCLGTGPEMWLRLQASYDLQEAQKTLGAAIEREVERA
ncbi:MAG: HigA family addiction module antitoxin [Alphaproteobacteria bacterium]